MKNILVLLVSNLLLLLAPRIATAQDFNPPKNYYLDRKEHYEEYEKHIIEAAKWWQNTPVNEQEEKHKKVAQFIVKWVNGSPTVFVSITEAIMKMEEKNTGMLVMFMAACSRYVLENNYSTDAIAKYRFALKAMMDVYQKNKGVKKDKTMEKLIKADKEGSLDTWMKENMMLDK